MTEQTHTTSYLPSNDEAAAVPIENLNATSASVAAEEAAIAQATYGGPPLVEAPVPGVVEIPNYAVPVPVSASSPPIENDASGKYNDESSAIDLSPQTIPVSISQPPTAVLDRQQSQPQSQQFEGQQPNRAPMLSQWQGTQSLQRPPRQPHPNNSSYTSNSQLQNQQQSMQPQQQQARAAPQRARADQSPQRQQEQNVMSQHLMPQQQLGQQEYAGQQPLHVAPQQQQQQQEQPQYSQPNSPTISPPQQTNQQSLPQYAENPSTAYHQQQQQQQQQEAMHLQNQGQYSEQQSTRQLPQLANADQQHHLREQYSMQQLPPQQQAQTPQLQTQNPATLITQQSAILQSPSISPNLPPEQIVGMVGTTPIVKIQGTVGHVVKKKKGRFKLLQESYKVAVPGSSATAPAAPEAQAVSSGQSLPTVVVADREHTMSNGSAVSLPTNMSQTIDGTGQPLVKKKGRFMVTNLKNPGLIAPSVPPSASNPGTQQQQIASDQAPPNPGIQQQPLDNQSQSSHDYQIQNNAVPGQTQQSMVQIDTVNFAQSYSVGMVPHQLLYTSQVDTQSSVPEQKPLSSIGGAGFPSGTPPQTQHAALILPETTPRQNHDTNIPQRGQAPVAIVMPLPDSHPSAPHFIPSPAPVDQSYQDITAEQQPQVYQQVHQQPPQHLQQQTSPAPMDQTYQDINAPQQTQLQQPQLYQQVQQPHSQRRQQQISPAPMDQTYHDINVQQQPQLQQPQLYQQVQQPYSQHHQQRTSPAPMDQTHQDIHAQQQTQFQQPQLYQQVQQQPPQHLQQQTMAPHTTNTTLNNLPTTMPAAQSTSPIPDRPTNDLAGITGTTPPLPMLPPPSVTASGEATAVEANKAHKSNVPPAQPPKNKQRNLVAPRNAPGYGIQAAGLGKVFYFLDQMRSEVTEADRTIKSLQKDMKFLREKNKEMEAKNRDLERRLKEEQALRQAAQAKLKDLKMRERVATNMTSTAAIAVPKSEEEDTPPQNPTCSSPEKEKPPAVSDQELINGSAVAHPTVSPKSGTVPLHAPENKNGNAKMKPTKNTSTTAVNSDPRSESFIADLNLPGIYAGTKRPVDPSKNAPSVLSQGGSANGKSDSPTRPMQLAPARTRDNSATNSQPQQTRAVNDLDARNSEEAARLETAGTVENALSRGGGAVPPHQNPPAVVAKAPSAIEFDPLRSAQPSVELRLPSEETETGLSTPLDSQSIASACHPAFQVCDTSLQGNYPVQTQFTQQFAAAKAIPIVGLAEAQTNPQQSGQFQLAPSLMANAPQSFSDHQSPLHTLPMSNLSVFQQPLAPLPDPETLLSVHTMPTEAGQPMNPPSPHVRGITMHDFSVEGLMAAAQLQALTESSTCLQDMQPAQRVSVPHHTRSNSAHNVPNGTWNHQQVDAANQWMNPMGSTPFNGNADTTMAGNLNQPQSQSSLSSDPFDELASRRQPIQ